MQKPRNLTIALVVIAFAQLMVVLDTTIVNVALPSVQRALGFGVTDLEWVVNGYALAFGGLLLLGGRAGDLFGRRRMFIAGVLLFATGSFLGGLANSPAWLIAARIVQGAGAAIVAPTALSLIADTFAEGRARNRALGIYAGAAGGGGAVGLVLGGLIVNYLSWRWVLFVNVPIALVLAAMAPRALAPGTPRPGRLDIPGALTVTGGMALIVYGLSRAATQGWSDAWTTVALGLGAALVVVFLLIELRSKQPLMPLAIFASRNRTGAYALRMLAGSMSLAVLFFLSQILQNVLGYSALNAGLAFLPLGAGVVVAAQVASRLVGRVGPRTLIGSGAGALTVGLVLLSRLTPGASYAPDILVPLVILAAGFGLIFLPTTVIAVAGATRHESGVASAVLNVSQQLGGSIGLAILGNVAVSSGFASAFGVGAWIAAGGLALALIAIRGTTQKKQTVETLAEAA